VAETLQLGRTLYPSLAKCRMILIGLAGKDFEMGAKLSPEIEAALPETVEMIQLEVNRLLMNPLETHKTCEKLHQTEGLC
jgi:Ni,Fe-hydrogenase maturation factor